jgi:hypothetical protein
MEIARIGNVATEDFSDAAATFGKGQQQDTGVGGEPSTVERGCEFPAGDGWQGEGDRDIVRHGGCGTGE